jgi:hypothetical protein
MRAHPMLALTAIALALASTGAAYYVLRDNTLPTEVEAAKPSSSSTASLTVKNTSLRDGGGAHPANPEQQRLTRVTEKLATLEARLRDLEIAAREPSTAPTGSSPDTPDASKGTKKATAKQLSEGDFGQWLDDALATGALDREATQLTREEMATSLAAVPGITLADLQCGEHFCRASFVPDNGNPPDTAQLMGASPFIESGFTLTEPDGSVRVYFTQPGQSFSELRSEARESALWDIYPQ